jgi:hypothetical protein
VYIGQIEGSSQPLRGHEPILDISAKVARGVIRSWTKKKYEGYWQYIHGQSQAKGFLKKTFC